MRVEPCGTFAFAAQPAGLAQSAAPVAQDSVELLTHLQSQGAELERKRLIGELGWRPVDPLQAAQALGNADPEDLRIKLPEHAWSTLRGPEDLQALNAFQKGDLTHLGPLAQQLDLLLRAGNPMTDEGVPVGAWGAYARLKVNQPVMSGSIRLENPQDAAMLAYLQNLTGPESLERPELGEALKSFQERGYLVGSPVELYRQKPARLELAWEGAPVGHWEQGKPEALLPQLESARLQYAREQLADVRPELREAAARELDRLPAAHRADFRQWLTKLENASAAANLSRMAPERQKAWSDWLARQVPRPVGQDTWAERDGVWKDSPDGLYRNNQDSSLTLPPMSLRRVAEPFFTFQVEHQLEPDRDTVTLEASRDGVSWEGLQTYTGTAPWADQKVSLDGYRGGDVRLRFRLKTDSSVEKEGVSIRAMRLEGRPDFEDSSRALWPCEKQPVVDAFIQAAAANQPLETFQSLVESVGASEAARLWPTLTPEMAGRVAELAPMVGVRAAEALARGGGQPATFLAARSLAHEPDNLDRVMEVHQRLSSLPPQAQEQVQWLVQRTVPSWTAEGGWLRNGDGSWSDSPGAYKNGQNASLTLPTLDLRHFTSPVATFRARHAFHSRADKVLVEASRDAGKTWDAVRELTESSDWKEHEIDLSGFGQGPLQLRFRLSTDSAGVAEGLDLSDFRLRARPTLQPDAPPQLIFSDHPEDRRPTLDAILAEAGGPRLERLGRLAAHLPPDQALKLVDLEADPEALAQAALRVGVPAARALADRLQDAGAFEVVREVAAQLQQPLRLEELVQQSQTARAQQVPNLLGWQTDGWVRDGAGSWSDNHLGRYRPGSNTSLTMPPVSLAGQKGACLRFDARFELPGNDEVRLELRSPGKDWHTLRQWKGGSQEWKAEEMPLSGLGDSKVELRWRLTSDTSGEGAGFRLRGVHVADSEQTFFSDRPEDLAPLHEELLTRLEGTLSDLPLERGLCVGLAVSNPALLRMVEVQGLKAALGAWDEMGTLQGEALETEVDRRNLSYSFLPLGADPGRLCDALRDAELKRPALAALDKLRQDLGRAGWTAQGDWSRTARGWSDSPEGPYKPNQKASLGVPPFQVPVGGARLEVEA